MIVVNCRFLTQPVTGVQRYSEEILTELIGLRGDLMLVAPDGDLRRSEIAGLPVAQIGSHRGHRWEQQDLPRFVRAQGKGSLLLSLTNTGPVTLGSQVITHHDVTYVRHPQTYSRAFRTAYRLMSGLALRRAAHVVTVSEFSRGEIADVYGIAPEKITVIPNAAGAEFAAAAVADPAEPYFLAVASVLPHKNLALLVRAFLTFSDETGSPTRLRLVGSKIRMSAEQEPIPDDPRVTWLGRVSDADLIGLYRGARALVFPSLYEGFGVPPLEAQACGCPVVSSDAASLPEVLRDSALFFSPHDEAQLVERLRRIDADESLRSDLRAAGYENVARYSWKDSARRLSALLDRVDTR